MTDEFDKEQAKRTILVLRAEVKTQKEAIQKLEIELINANNLILIMAELNFFTELFTKGEIDLIIKQTEPYLERLIKFIPETLEKSDDYQGDIEAFLKGERASIAQELRSKKDKIRAETEIDLAEVTKIIMDRKRKKR